MQKFHIYLIGVVLLGLVYEPVRSLVGTGGGWWCLFVALVYLLTIRLIADRFGKP